MKKELAKPSLAQAFEPRICYLSDVSSQSSGSEVIKSELLDMSLAQVRFKIPLTWMLWLGPLLLWEPAVSQVCNPHSLLSYWIRLLWGASKAFYSVLEVYITGKKEHKENNKMHMEEKE